MGANERNADAAKDAPPAPPRLSLAVKRMAKLRTGLKAGKDTDMGSLIDLTVTCRTLDPFPTEDR